MYFYLQTPLYSESSIMITQLFNFYNFSPENKYFIDFFIKYIDQIYSYFYPIENTRLAIKHKTLIRQLIVMVQCFDLI